MKKQNTPQTKFVLKETVEEYKVYLQKFTTEFNEQLTLNLVGINGVEYYEVLNATIKLHADNLKGLSSMLRKELKPKNVDRL